MAGSFQTLRSTVKKHSFVDVPYGLCTSRFKNHMVQDGGSYIPHARFSL